MAGLEGQHFAGFEVISVLGRGGMGEVYRARQAVLDRIVALKVIAARVAADPAFVTRFQQEAKAAAQLNHPHIVQVYSAGEHEGLHYLVQEFVDGENLHDRLARDGRMDPQEALAVCVFVAEGLQYAWDEAHIIHRDIKPANIFLSKKGAVKIGDLGLAKSVGPEAGAALTQSGMTVGTPYYCSPEQAQAEKDIDFRADIYSLGCTLYHMLSGQKPYESGPDQSPMSILIKQATQPPPAILQVLPTCPGPVVMLLGKMLAKHPSGRHASYHELIADLTRIHGQLGPPPAAAPISSALRAAAAPKKKSPAMIYGAAAAAVVVLVGGLLLWAPWKQSGPGVPHGESKSASSVSPGSAGILPAAVEEPKPAPKETPKTAPAVLPKPPEKIETAAATPKPSVPVAAPAPTAGKMPALPGPAPVDSAFLAAVAALDPEDQVSRVMDKLALLNPKFDGKQTHKIEVAERASVRPSSQPDQSQPDRTLARSATPVVTELSFSSAEVSDLSPLKALKDLQSLNCAGAGQRHSLSDLSPLKGLKLTKLACPMTAVSDLTPLAGMPLTSLQISNTKVADLSPLKGAPLAWLSCVDAPVKDLAPLAGMPLATLWIRGTAVTDLSPLRGMMLKELDCELSVASAEANKEALFAIKTLETIGGQPAADFWKSVGTPEDPWFKQVAALPGEKQVPALMAKLKELNPGFDGREQHKSENVAERASVRPDAASQTLARSATSDITELRFSAVGVTNIVPVKALTGLKKLMLMPWAANQKQLLADLSPLQGMPLTMLACGGSQVSDLTPLKGMPLTILGVDNTPVADLSPLAGMPLTILWCDHAQVTDLSPLSGMPLQELRCDFVPQRDKNVLATLPTLQKINNESAKVVWMRLGIRPGSAGILPASGGAVATQPPAGKMPALPGATPSSSSAQPGQPFVTSTGMELLYIPPGEFLMGSTPEERAWAHANGSAPQYTQYEGEQPRKTAIKQGFWLGKTEVTAGQWKQFVAATSYVTDAEKKGYADDAPIGPGKPRGKNVPGVSWKDPNFGFKLKDNHPVSCISWNDAVAFCEWLSEREQKSGRLPPGFKVRLPAEAEWEYACRAGKQTKFWWGETKEGGDNRLNWDGTADGFEFVSPVDHYGSRGRNKFGLADMLGNVREWCLDEFDRAGAHEEPYKGYPSMRVERGGSSINPLGFVRCATHQGVRPDNSGSLVGFRVAVGMDVTGASSAVGGAAGSPAKTAPVPQQPVTPPATPPVVPPTPPSVAATAKGAASPATSQTLARSATSSAQPGQPFVTSTGIEMLYIPPGEFLMGSTPEERAWANANGCRPEYTAYEGQQPRKTAIKQGLWMGRTEVTVGQWKQFVAATGYVTDSEKTGSAYSYDRDKKAWVDVKGANWQDPKFGIKVKDNHPACCISWNDAKAFCEWLNEREQKSGRLPPGYQVRLPMEAEWEYACRAGKQTKFWWGETKEGGDNRLNWQGTADGFEFVSPVDHYGARGRNKFGLADMLGNVREWCLDEFDPVGAHEEPYTGNPLERVVRGGAFNFSLANARCASRATGAPRGSGSIYGFRVAVGMEPSAKILSATPASSDATQKPPSVPPTTSPAVTPTPPRTDALTLPRSTSAAAAAQPGQPFVTSTGIEMLYIPPGEFLMGSTPEERAWANANGCEPKYTAYEGEAPRKTAIKQGFWLGKTEVTVGQWKQFVNASGYQTDAEKKGHSDYSPKGAGQKWGPVDGASWKDPNFGFKVKDNHAVCCISWNDAMAFCEWLSEREQKSGRLPPGFKVRLPGEAEWEYACRAGKQTKFWWGERKEDGDNRLNWSGKEDGFEFVSPVDNYKARGRNKFGLADMLGNVREWCLDAFDPAGAHEEYFAGSDPKAARVLRGGPFSYNPAGDRCASRGPYTPSYSNCYNGFRVAVGLAR